MYIYSYNIFVKIPYFGCCGIFCLPPSPYRRAVTSTVAATATFAIPCHREFYYSSSVWIRETDMRTTLWLLNDFLGQIRRREGEGKWADTSLLLYSQLFLWKKKDFFVKWSVGLDFYVSMADSYLFPLSIFNFWRQRMWLVSGSVTFLNLPVAAAEINKNVGNFRAVIETKTPYFKISPSAAKTVFSRNDKVH